MEAAKTMDMLIIDPPNELHFSGPFNRPVITVMKLTNPTDKIILFKIKTTAPKRYCVRPNFGLVGAHAVTKVEICLQPFEYDPNEKNKHKFMVQSLVAPEGPIDDINKVWKEGDPVRIVDAKLKCVFDMPKEQEASEPTAAASYNSPLKMMNDYGTRNANTASSHSPAMENSNELMVEVKQLREENMNLRKEATSLKETTLRLKTQLAKPIEVDKHYAPMSVDKPVPIFYIAISIAAAIFGLLLGKYLL